MANLSKKKIKLLYLSKVLLDETDEKCRMSTQDLIEYLGENEIEIERKTIFADIATLKDFGLDIAVSKEREGGGYYIKSREYSLTEIKLITEAILSSRFISKEKSKELINKLSRLVGPSERKELKREVFVQGRVKTENESVFSNVDTLHSAMIANSEVSFMYLNWNANKEMVPRKGGKLYRVSPWALTVKDEYYYLVAFDDESGLIKHYRVDKMQNIKCIKDSQRKGHDTFNVYDIGAYTNQIFGMFSGEPDIVSLGLPEDKIGIVLDRFGKDVDLRPLPDGRVSIRVDVEVSKQFFGWIAGIGTDIEILRPPSVREEYRLFLKEILDVYKE